MVLSIKALLEKPINEKTAVTAINMMVTGHSEKSMQLILCQSYVESFMQRIVKILSPGIPFYAWYAFWLLAGNT